MSKTQTEKLFNLIPKLGAVEFVGLARVLKVQLMDETNPQAENVKDRFTPRPFLDVLEDMLAAYEQQSRERRRDILKIVKEATKRGEKDAGNSKDT